VKLFLLALSTPVLACAALTSCRRTTVADQTKNNVSTFSSIVDTWEAYQNRRMVAFSKRVEELYRKNLKNPQYRVDSNGKRVAADPMHSALRMSRLPKTFTPAFSMFDYHVNDPEGALIGGIDPEAARLRLWFEDNDMAAQWSLYRFERDGRLRSVPTFSDSVSRVSESRSIDGKKLFDLVAASWCARKPKSGTIEGWSYETCFLRYSDASCITCHSLKKIGDVGAVMLYRARVKTDRQTR